MPVSVDALSGSVFRQSGAEYMGRDSLSPSVGSTKLAARMESLGEASLVDFEGRQT